eukprot:COSAG02_NODE_22036_length_765_cov_84.209491_1_plen_134_part_00
MYEIAARKSRHAQSVTRDPSPIEFSYCPGIGNHHDCLSKLDQYITEILVILCRSELLNADPSKSDQYSTKVRVILCRSEFCAQRLSASRVAHRIRWKAGCNYEFVSISPLSEKGEFITVLNPTFSGFDKATLG